MTKKGLDKYSMRMRGASLSKSMMMISGRESVVEHAMAMLDNALVELLVLFLPLA